MQGTCPSVDGLIDISCFRALQVLEVKIIMQNTFIDSLFFTSWQLRNFTLKIPECYFFSLKPCSNGRNIVGCYILCPFAHPVACCCIMFVAWCLWHKVWNRSNFWAKNSRTLFCFMISPKHSTTKSDLFVQLFQHCWGNACALHVVSFKFTKSYGLIGVSFPRCSAGLNFQQCWELLHLFARSLFSYL